MPKSDGHDNRFIDELLCFMQNKMRSLPVDNVIKLCLDFYSPEQIESSKLKLYTHTESCRDSRSRFIKRIGDRKSKDNLQDIVKVLLSLELEDIPSYLAQDLSRIPPLSAFDNDIIALHRDIEMIKSNLAIVKDCHKDVTVIKQDLNELRQVQSHTFTTQCRSASSGTQTDLGVATSISAPESQQRQSTDEVNESINTQDHDSDNTTKEDTSDSETESELASLNNQTYSRNNDVRARQTDALDSLNNHSNGYRNEVWSGVWSTQTDRSKQKGKHVQSEAAAGHQTRQHNAYGGGKHRSHREQKQRGNQTVIASGNFNGLHAVRKHEPKEVPNPNRRVTGVFITRLHPRTTEKKIAQHVRQETNLKVTPQKLKTKYEHYSSFYIQCDNVERRMMMDPNLWPQGTLLKPYYSYYRYVVYVIFLQSQVF
jgi:hypothetical protein